MTALPLPNSMVSKRCIIVTLQHFHKAVYDKFIATEMVLYVAGNLQYLTFKSQRRTTYLLLPSAFR